METRIKPGMNIRINNPYRPYDPQDEMEVQWVGQDGNKVIVAGYLPNAISTSGSGELRPHHGTYSCYDWGKSFAVVMPVDMEWIDLFNSTQPIVLPDGTVRTPLRDE